MTQVIPCKTVEHVPEMLEIAMLKSAQVGKNWSCQSFAIGKNAAPDVKGTG